MRYLCYILLLLLAFSAQAQQASITGSLIDQDQKPLVFATVILYSDQETTFVKASITDQNGKFIMSDISVGIYRLESSMLGFSTKNLEVIVHKQDEQIQIPTQELQLKTEALDEVTLTVSKPIVEVKNDRTILNVAGTINSSGNTAFSLLRKAPAVTIDASDNLALLGREGVVVYINGKQVPLTGEELAQYLKSIPSEQIEQLDIITNPGVAYDAAGNAGIIDIQLVKKSTLGANGSLSSTLSQGVLNSTSLNASGNYRDTFLNVFATVAASNNNRFSKSRFDNFQNDLRLLETNDFNTNRKPVALSVGTDLFIGEVHTVGVLLNVNNSRSTSDQLSEIAISQLDRERVVDSTLIVDGATRTTNERATYNVNYLFKSKTGIRFNLDVDYGTYATTSDRIQPNRFVNPDGVILQEVINKIKTPTAIDIFTIKTDVNNKFLGGNIAVGAKFSNITTLNTYLFFDKVNENFEQRDTRSRIFNYSEAISAGYASYSRHLSNKWDINLGVRYENTRASGDLKTFNSTASEPPVRIHYDNWFPNLGITWKPTELENIKFTYGKRINRPNYFVLNPFRDQITALSFERGNPFLRPEISTNFELAYAKTSAFNLSLFYNRTTDKITRLVGPDDNDPRATFSSFENLGKQTIYGGQFNFAKKITTWFKTNLNVNASQIKNEAAFEDGSAIDVQLFTYKVSSQNTINLPKNIKAEVSGYYNGPAIFGSVFEIEPNWSVDIGLQKAFFSNQLQTRLTITDVFYTSNFKGQASFNDLTYFGSGRRDSRRCIVSVSYNFGNQDIKGRKHAKGLDAEENRL